MGYKILTKESIENFIKKYEGSLYIEIYHASKPTNYLKVYTTGGGMTLGRVSARIFTWFTTEWMKEQPPYINVSWRKFSKSDGVILNSKTLDEPTTEAQAITPIINAVNPLVMESLPPTQTVFWPCPNCGKDTSETKWLCCCSQECCKEYMDKHKQLSSGNAP